MVSTIFPWSLGENTNSAIPTAVIETRFRQPSKTKVIIQKSSLFQKEYTWYLTTGTLNIIFPSAIQSVLTLSNVIFEIIWKFNIFYKQQ